MNELMRQAVEEIVAIGKWVRAKSSELHIEVKGFADYVTNIDMEVQNRLQASLSSLAPRAVFISEENEHNDYGTSLPHWIIDPIDGTTNLIHGYPHVAISVAYKDAERHFGIVYNPFNDELFTAESGGGAYRNGVPISVSQNTRMEQCLIGFGLPYDRSKSRQMFRTAERIYETCQDMKRKGPCSLDLAYVAAGRIDAYAEVDLKIWDIAAGLIVLSESGGMATDWDGKPLMDGLRMVDLVASNCHIHEAMLTLIEDSRLDKE